MFNKDVLKKSTKKDVLDMLSLSEKYDKFNDVRTLTPSFAGILMPFKLGGMLDDVISEIFFIRNKLDKEWSYTLHWQFLIQGQHNEPEALTKSKNAINSIKEIKFLFYAGDLESVNFDKREAGGSRVLKLEENLLLKIIRAETLEIRVETEQKTYDYNAKKCKKLQEYLKENYEKFLDLEEFENLQANGTLDSTRDITFNKTKSDSKGKSKLGSIIKWWLIISVLVAIATVMFEKKDTGDKNLSKSSSPQQVVPQPESKVIENNPDSKNTESDSPKKE